MDRFSWQRRRAARRTWLVVMGLMGATAACTPSDAPRPNGRPSIRLSPTSITAGGIDAARTIDRDTTVPVAVSGAATLRLDFGHEVEIRRVKFHGATALEVECDGLSLGEPDEAGWASGTLSTPRQASSLSLTLAPAGPGASFNEIEVWGAGLDAAPRDPGALAAHTRDPKAVAFENAWTLRPAPDAATLKPLGVVDGTPCLRSRFPAFLPRQARRAYLAFEANVPRGVVFQHSFNGNVPVDGVWLGTTADQRTLVDELDPESLNGGDELLLCLPDDAAVGVSVTGLRLLLVLDDGANPFDREAALRFGAAIDGLESTAAPASGAQEFALDRAMDVEEAELRLGSVPAQLLGLASRRDLVWTEQPGLDLLESPAALPINGLADAVRVTLGGDGAAPGISELSLKGSGVGARIGGPRIVCCAPPDERLTQAEIT